MGIKDIVNLAAFELPKKEREGGGMLLEGYNGKR